LVFFHLKLSIFYIFLFLILGRGVFAFLFLFLAKILAKKTKWNRDLQRPFECGFSPKDEFRSPFSVHFFLMALIFVLFDVELVILFPLIIRLRYYHSLFIVRCYISFILFITWGLINEWDRIGLEWSK